ncbi:MAG TPA: hypothetical protein VIM03_06810, partial [Thermoleophilaceae bacterium]
MAKDGSGSVNVPLKAFYQFAYMNREPLSNGGSFLASFAGCRSAHAYIGARGAAQEVVGAFGAAAHSLPG